MPGSVALLFCLASDKEVAEEVGIDSEDVSILLQWGSVCACLEHLRVNLDSQGLLILSNCSDGYWT